MSPPAASGGLSLERQRVAQLVEAGTPFLELEEVITYRPLPPDQKTVSAKHP
jgi:hypothetical protein